MGVMWRMGTRLCAAFALLRCIWPLIVALLAAATLPLAASSSLTSSRQRPSLPYVFSGASGSHARFSRWLVCPGSMLSFEFETSQPDGLLVYVDDGGVSDYLELKLVKSRLRVRLRLGSTKQPSSLLVIGEGLSDRQWHRVDVVWSGQDITAGVDSIFARWRAGPTALGNAASLDIQPAYNGSEMFVGGIPETVALNPAILTLPTAAYERRLAGSITNITYRSCTSDYESPTLLSSSGLRTRSENFCATRNPCLHSGRCLNMDSEPVCDCTYTRYEGRHCTKEKIPIISSFSGHDYIVYNISKPSDPIITSQEVIDMSFKTRQPTAFLMLSADNSDYIFIGLRDGVPHIAVSLGSSHHHVQFKDALRLDDDQWHQVRIMRDARELTADKGISNIRAEVDGQFPETRSFTGSFSMLSSQVIYLAGSGGNRLYPALRAYGGFVGCMKHVTYAAETVTFDLLRMAKEESKLAQKHGAVSFNDCRGSAAAQGRAAAFLSRDAYVALSPWVARSAGSLSLSFTTASPCGLLLYQSRTAGRGDMFAVEIVDGLLFVLIDLGSGFTKVRASEQFVSDGLEHSLTVQHNGRTGSVQLDKARRTYSVDAASGGGGGAGAGVSFGSDGPLEKGGPLFVAGVSSASEEAAQLPPELWSANLKCSFVGCIHSMALNGELVDLVKAGHEQDVNIQSYCPAPQLRCSSQPCTNGGLCSEGLDRYVCDCSFTDYFGRSCSEPVIALQFSGDQYFKIFFKKMIVTQAEDMLIRFRTKQSYGRLLATSEDSSTDRLEMFIHAGRLLVTLKLGGSSKLVQVGEALNDNRYHTAKLSRRGRFINLTLDQQTVTEEILEGDRLTLPIQALQLASYDHDGVLSSQTNFIGHIQKVQLNGVDLMKLLQAANKRYETDTNAIFDDKDPPVRLPISFVGNNGHATLATLATYPTLSLFFQFRTTASDGLLFYNGGRGGDFFLLELVGGGLRTVFRKGPSAGESSQHSTVIIDSPAGVNDGRWHDVTVTRGSDGRSAMRVDWSGWLRCNASCGSTSQSQPATYELSGPLYVGGMPVTAATHVATLLGRQPFRGFVGCLGSLDINGMRSNLATDGNSKFSATVHSGCNAFDALCTDATCRNGGICSPRGTGGDLCNCDATSFTGPVCSEDSTTYLFGGSKPGAIEYVIAPEHRLDTRDDRLAFGFLSQSNNSVLFKATSGNSADYIEVRIKDGYIYAVYNIGSQDHPITDALYPVVDGNYHVVRFERLGPNATLQLDGRPIQIKVPSGEQLIVFNSLASIAIGGKLEIDRLTVTQPFKGLISGLVFNKMRLLDRAKDNHSSVRFVGDVRLADLQSTKLSPPMSSWTSEELAKRRNEDIVLAANENACANSVMLANCVSVHRDTYGGNDNLVVPTISVLRPMKTATSTTSRILVRPSSYSAGTKVDPSVANPILPDLAISALPRSLNTTVVMPAHAGGRESAATENEVDPMLDQEGGTTFDLTKNIPLVGGISGAVVLTVLLVIIVACKFSRKEGGAYKVKKSVTMDDNLQNDINGKRQLSTSPGSAKGTATAGSGSTGKSVREWYV